MDDLEKFTQFLFGDSAGFVHCPLKLRDKTWNANWFHWPSQKEELHDFVRTSAIDSDVYLSPAIYSNKKAVKENVKSTRTVWVEFDGQTQIDFKDIPEPSVIIQSSTDTHQHCYWFVPNLKPEVAEDISKRLTYYFEADSSGWDITQVLRPPLTKNHKSQIKPLDTKLVKFSPTGLEAKDFDKAPTVEIPDIVVLDYGDLLDEKQVRQLLTNELTERVFVQQATLQGRSHLLMSIAHNLAEHGLEHNQILSALYIADSRIKKFVGRTDQLYRLSQIASIAVFKYGRENEIQGYSPFDIIEHEENLEWLIHGWLHTKGMLFLSGAPGVGKTQYSFDMAYRIATGSPIISKDASKPVAVAYFSLEMDVLELKYIFEKQAKDFENKALWKQNVTIYPFEDANFVQFEKVIKETKPAVVFIDSLSEIVAEDMKETEAKRIMLWFKKMRRKHGVSFVVIHHNRKASDTNKKPVKLSDLYGSFQFAAKSETVITLYDTERGWLELIVLKARFGRSGTIKLQRTENLTFVGEDNSVTVVDGGNPLTDSILGFGDESRIN